MCIPIDPRKRYADLEVTLAAASQDVIHYSQLLLPHVCEASFTETQPCRAGKMCMPPLVWNQEDHCGPITAAKKVGGAPSTRFDNVDSKPQSGDCM